MPALTTGNALCKHSQLAFCMQLKQLSRIVVQFAPALGNCRSAREFLKRATGPTAKKSNPDCQANYQILLTSVPLTDVTLTGFCFLEQVEVKLRKGGDPEVHVVYNNAQKNSINISSMSASQIEEEISQVRIVCTRASAAALHKTGFRQQPLPQRQCAAAGGHALARPAAWQCVHAHPAHFWLPSRVTAIIPAHAGQEQVRSCCSMKRQTLQEVG